ncbi:MAG: hypothetical protein ACYDGM_11160, partial [Vulcanimicrobiaceae bacterium]
MFAFRMFLATLLVLAVAMAPAFAARPIVDLHSLDAYFALFAQDSNVPWKPATVRLDTYSGTPVDFAIYKVDPGDVLTAGSNARPRAIDTRGRKPITTFRYSPPGGYQFGSNEVPLPLGNRQGFFVVEARRGNVGEQVWINRTRVGLLTKETPGQILIYGADLGSGRALARMRVQFVVGSKFVTRLTDAHGIVTWDRSPRPVFALAQWGQSYAFVSLLPQAPLPTTIVGVRTQTAVVHAGEAVHVVGFVRARSGETFRAATGEAAVSLRNGGTLIAQERVPLDAAGTFTATMAVPPAAAAGDYALLAQADGAVGSASVHVDADANGLSLQLASCESACNPAVDVPVTITASRGDVPVRVVVVRSPHVFVDHTPQGTPWATSRWLDVTVRTDANGRATVMIPNPTDGLASTYGVRASSGGATADTRIIVPTARAAIRLHLDRHQQTLGTPVEFDVYLNDVGSGKPVGGALVTVRLQHGTSVEEQRLRLDAQGHARGAFSSAQLGTNLIFASATVGGAVAMDANQVEMVPQATADAGGAGSGNVRVTLDRSMYRRGEAIRARADLPGARGDVLFTLESALGAQIAVVPSDGGAASARLTATDAPGDMRIGAAFVRDGAMDWTAVPLALDAPGRPAIVPLDLERSGATAKILLRGALGGPGTIVVRVSRGEPSGSARFESAPALLAVGLAATQNSAPAGTTWHPWVDSTGEHAQVLGFVRRSLPPPDLTIAQADSQTMSWSVQ